MTDIAIATRPSPGRRSSRGRTPPGGPSRSAYPCSTWWCRCTTSRPPSPTRCTGCTAICARASRSGRASPSPTTPASTTHRASPPSSPPSSATCGWCGSSRRAAAGRCTQVWSASDAPVLAYMDVDLSTDLAALAPLVAPLISGHSDLAIGTRLGRGSRVVRGAKREIISRCYNLILKSTLAARLLGRPVRLQGHPRRRRRSACCPTSPTPGGSSTPNCWCWPNAAGCASTRFRWTGSTIRTAGWTSSPPRRPTSRASAGCCAASPTARFR